MENQKVKLHFRRFEFKYLLPIQTADKIIPSLLSHMKWDPYVVGKKGEYYVVNSLYYDSAGFGCYYEKIAGVSARSKFRLRFYNFLQDDSKIFIEIKRKRDNIIIKDRVAESVEKANQILNFNSYPEYLTNLSNNERKVLEEFLWAKNYACLKPQIMVSYLRRPLISKYDNKFRITFDYNIKAYKSKWLGEQTGLVKNVLTDNVILELKYNNFLPIWFYEIIEKYKFLRIPYSKYCNSLEKIYPNLIN
ncbi:polyphosphate polymerase domain-containing protein [bacterium]|nr:polyphosphate polymerase domain-containing protein [bacterium]